MAWPPSHGFVPPTVVPRRGSPNRLALLWRTTRNPLSALPAAIYEEPIYQYDRRLTWVADPTLIKTVLLESHETFRKSPLERRVLGPLLGKGLLISEEGDWKWQRQTTAPVFRHADVLSFLPQMVEAAEQTVNLWKQCVPGTLRRIEHDVSEASFRVIVETMLPSGDANGGSAFERSDLDRLRYLWRVAIAMLGLPAWMPHPHRSATHRAEQRIRRAVLEFVRGRRHTSTSTDDLFSRLARAQHPETGAHLSDEQMVDNLLSFLIAGHATTARALTWALYLVACSPEWERRLVDEIGSVVGDGPILPEHIGRLVEVSRVVREALRLYPPVPEITRIASADTELGGKTIRAGSLIMIPIFALHRHRRLWPDPDHFAPDRAAPQQPGTLARYQFMPFGAGPRICIGQAFAMIEITAMLAVFLRAFRLETKPGHVPIPVARVTLQPSGGMPMRVWRRR